MSNNKKPTMMEVKYAITNLISEFGNLRDHVMKMDNIFSDYIFLSYHLFYSYHICTQGLY